MRESVKDEQSSAGESGVDAFVGLVPVWTLIFANLYNNYGFRVEFERHVTYFSASSR